MSDVADKRIAELEREIRGREEMLYQVLKSVDDKVFVPKESMVKGIEQDMVIVIDEDLQKDGFVFYLRKLEEDDDQEA